MFAREVNEKGIMEAEIAVIIPSFKEADSIAHPVKMADEGLRKYFGDRKSVIINADNASPDGTENVFLNVETETPKIYITTPENTPGKGWNFENAWRKCCSLGVKVIVCVDADLISITPEWIEYMVSPVLHDGYDYLTPIYSRHKYDGTITNNICYPLIYGIFGYNIRQPIGGDFAMSIGLAEYLLKQPWHKTTYEYGIDIFMTMNAILGGFKIAQVGLGAKIHKPSAPKLGEMFIQVVSTALLSIVNNFDKWKDLTSVRELGVFGIQELAPAQDLEVDRELVLKNSIESYNKGKEVLREVLSSETFEKLDEMFSLNKVEIDSELWVDILFDFLVVFKYYKDRLGLVEAMKGLYFGRVYSFMNQTWELSSADTEKPIREQGQRVFERREELIGRLKDF